MALQVSYTAHWLPGLSTITVLSGRTAHKLPVKISAPITRFIVAHMVKETKHRRTLTNRYPSDLHSADRLDRRFKQLLEKRVVSPSPKQIAAFLLDCRCFSSSKAA